MKKILYFESAGMEGTQRNDVENCRIRTAFTNNKGKKIYLELSGNEINKYNKYELYKDFEIGTAIMHIDACFYITDDPEIDDCNKSRISLKKDNKPTLYTKKNILNIVNNELNCSFDEVVILPWLSGYNVHSGKGKYNTSERYNFIEDFTYIPEQAEERKRIYNEVATEYFDNIYKKNAKLNNAERLYKPMRKAHSLLDMDDNTITIKSYTYKELINDNERVKVFEVAY